SNSPWGSKEHEMLVSEAESELERKMAATIMQQGSRPEFRRLATGQTLTEEGAEGGELFLLLDGMLAVEVDGEPIAEVGPAPSSARGRSSRVAVGLRRSEL